MIQEVRFSEKPFDESLSANKLQKLVRIHVKQNCSYDRSEVFYELVTLTSIAQSELRRNTMRAMSEVREHLELSDDQWDSDT